MRGILSAVFAAISGLVVIAVVAEFFLAGAGLFGAITGYQPHIIVGMSVATAAIVLLLLAIVGRLGRSLVIHSAALLVLMLIQIALIEIDKPWIEALHPLNALLILGASVQLAMRSGLLGRRNRAAGRGVDERAELERGV